MSNLQPLSFPAEPAAWAEFASAGATSALAEVNHLVEQLKGDPDLSLVAKLEAWNNIEITIQGALGIAYVISEAHPQSDVREVAEDHLRHLEALSAQLVLDDALWRAFADQVVDGLDDDNQRFLTHIQRDFRRAGVGLDAAGRARAQELANRDTELSQAFSRNVRDGRRELRVAIADLDGMPQDFFDDRPADSEGFITLSTDYVDLMPVREYARNARTRRAMVALDGDLAWPENQAVLAELLTVRAERAALLGYRDWSDYETETRMIGSGSEVASFLERLAEASEPAVADEYAQLLERLRKDDPDATEVSVADFWYLLGALKAEKHGVDAQRVRSYFAFENVLPGVLDTTAALLGIEYVPVKVPTWHDDVRSYDVLQDGTRIGRIHLDLHPREGKYNHAACFPLVPGITDRALPEGTLLCNFSRGLLTHDEVVTFFHEFGHLVHHILAGKQSIGRFSGVATEWDFVEAPSQLLEEWAWDPQVLATFARNAEGEPIPAELVAQMREADGFGRALELRRQLGHANVSLRLHVDVPADLQAASEECYRRASPIVPVPGLNTYASFGHLTGYGSCYYTYQWSLVIARDLLSGFGDDLMGAEAAARYRALILEPGGSRNAVDLVSAFLGRPYSFDAYAGWLAGS